MNSIFRVKNIWNIDKIGIVTMQPLNRVIGRCGTKQVFNFF